MLRGAVVVTLVLGACGGAAQEAPEQIGDSPASSSAAPVASAGPTATAVPTPTATYRPDTLDGITIALDAGHGPGDKGASGYCVDEEVTEADVNLRTREILQRLLESVGATIYLVPQAPSREARVEAAEDAGADVLLSIHHNGYEDSDLNYTMTFVSDEADMLLASYVHPMLVEALALDNSEIQFEEFGMTSNGDIPAILTEATFITNDIEACNFLGNQSRIEAEALALFHGLVAYFRGEGLTAR